ncbi:hypothetical protein ACIOEX_28640 [Streptomyces sp. NPDC087850]|uniref:hypothetical protein n=1 Tax=Streptomyces sp. NPDC087850 TaxID=3365809 RepID=UPI0038246AFB
MSEPNWPPSYIDDSGQPHAWDDPWQNADGEVDDPDYTYRAWAYDMAEAHVGGEIETWLDREALRTGTWIEEEDAEEDDDW